MNCEEATKLMDGYLDGELDPRLQDVLVCNFHFIQSNHRQRQVLSMTSLCKHVFGITQKRCIQKI